MKRVLSLYMVILLAASSASAKSIRVVQLNKTFIGDISDTEATTLATNVDAIKAKKIETLNAKVGDQIVFSNRDIATHNINGSIGTDPIFDVGAQPPGKDHTVDLKKKGEYEVRCAIHPKMKMKIVVE